MSPITQRERDIAHQAVRLAGLGYLPDEVLPEFQVEEIVTRLRQLELAPLLAQAIMPMYPKRHKPAPRFCGQCGSVQHGTSSPCPDKVTLREGCPECGRMKPCHAPGCGRDPDNPKPAKPRRWIVEEVTDIERIGSEEWGHKRLFLGAGIFAPPFEVVREVKPVTRASINEAIWEIRNSPEYKSGELTLNTERLLRNLGIEVEE